MPRVKKFSRRRKRASNPTSCQRKAQFPAKRKQWTDQQMIDAMEAASAGNMSINKASEMYGVPRTTLKDRLNGRVVHGTKPGPKPYLRHSEERELVDHLTKLSDLGMGKKKGTIFFTLLTLNGFSNIIQKQVLLARPLQGLRILCPQLHHPPPRPISSASLPPSLGRPVSSLLPSLI